MENIIVLNPRDNVGNAIDDIEESAQGQYRTSAGECCIKALQSIPFGFKIAIDDIEAGGYVYKYGEIIGKAKQKISKGELVHIHNIEGTRGRGDL